jgi:hypothetical protein
MSQDPIAWLHPLNTHGVAQPPPLSSVQESGTTEGKHYMLKSLRKLATALRTNSTEDREMAYLNGSVDRFDLEYRQRQVDRGLFRR